ncbi:putative component of anaerobic dehydrogenase [Halanaeroarchaeum sp. HSR-CO]|uniref:TorD/DmsD family molecular chaperone n=1 Tax=Halanaeroarchaeum sp. HSR-CO TaxID=2866382 RepID=UPI00217D3C70|nr:molecular chaperone TorD family protein [Halanaeroarchaeum sp. HSR-CO]UWG46622.1 putative component of anaerobic dehydrogenase [Halanaeroarchaeum sp. HSR-CO]
MSAESADGDRPSPRVDERWGVVASCWRRPDEQLRAALESGLFEASLSERPPLKRLRVEHMRLFDGPGEHPCPPYESVYRDAEPDEELGPVMGPSTEAVTRWYAEYGLSAESWSDLPDHVAAELEFAGWLSAHGETQAMERFLDEHPREWMPAFLDGVESATTEPFYAVLADATRELIGEEEP